MIIFSRSCQNARVILLRNYRPNKPVRNASFLKQIDKESYLNKKPLKNQFGFIESLTLLVPVTCASLALWQVNRKRWKDQLVSDLRERTKLPAIDLPEDLTDRLKLEYRKVRVRGVFDHSREMYLRPRSKIVDSRFAESEPIVFPSLSPTRPDKPNIGAVVVTPFKVTGRDVEILVNRGWVPIDEIDPATRQKGQIEGEVEIEGIIRLKENKPSTPGPQRFDYKTFTYRDIEAMSEQAGGTSYFYVDATVDSTVPGGPLGGQTLVHLKNNHFEYILTWSTLALYTTYMWYKRWILKLH